MEDSASARIPFVGVMNTPSASLRDTRTFASLNAPPDWFLKTSTALPRIRKEFSSAPIFMSRTSSPDAV